MKIVSYPVLTYRFEVDENEMQSLIRQAVANLKYMFGDHWMNTEEARGSTSYRLWQTMTEAQQHKTDA